MNYRHYNAQQAGRDSVELFTLLFFKDREEKATGLIMSCKKNGIKVWIPKFGLEGTIFINHTNKVGAKLGGSRRRICLTTTTPATSTLTPRRVS